ncbi:MAG: oligoendopeptidase F, partial [Caldimonas sp.]
MKMSLALTGALCAAAVSTVAIAAKPTTRHRAEIPAEFRWDFSAIYPNWAAWEEGMKEMDARMATFVTLKGTLAQGPAQVLKAYQAYDDIGKLQYRLYRYPQLQRDVDTRDQAVAARFQRMAAVFAKFETASAWFTPELLSLPEATVADWIKKTPGLAPYRFTILDEYRRKAHVLDAEGERLLSLSGPSSGTPRTVYQELATSDIRFPTLHLGDGSD